MTSTQLMEFIKATSRGAEFERAYNVEHSQIHKAWETFLKGRPHKYLVENKDVIRGRTLDKWDDYL